MDHFVDLTYLIHMVLRNISLLIIVECTYTTNNQFSATKRQEYYTKVYVFHLNAVGIVRFQIITDWEQIVLKYRVYLSILVKICRLM